MYYWHQLNLTCLIYDFQASKSYMYTYPKLFSDLAGKFVAHIQVFIEIPEESISFGLIIRQVYILDDGWDLWLFPHHGLKSLVAIVLIVIGQGAHGLLNEFIELLSVPFVKYRSTSFVNVHKTRKDVFFSTIIVIIKIILINLMSSQRN